MIVLDFDGTMTDAEVEGGPFRAGYLEDLALLTDQPLEEIHRLAEAFEAEVAGQAGSFGWVYDGRIVAPACVDPYLRIMPVARKVFDRFGCFPGEVDRARLLDHILYKYNYRKTCEAFRPGAKEILASLERRDLHIVTNSYVEAVQEKIQRLGDLDWLLPRIHGTAKKYVLDPYWEGVQESMRLPGLERPVLLRRRLYHDVISRLLDGRPWSELVVVGDIFELDLALPLALGARVVLMANAFTPADERAWLSSHPRGKVLDEVWGLAELL